MDGHERPGIVAPREDIPGPEGEECGGGTRGGSELDSDGAPPRTRRLAVIVRCLEIDKLHIEHYHNMLQKGNLGAHREADTGVLTMVDPTVTK